MAEERFIRENSKLKEIKLSSVTLTSTGLKIILKNTFPTLESLECIRCFLNDIRETKDYFEKCSKLKSINVSKNLLTNDDLSVILASVGKQLELLDVSFTLISNIDEDSFNDNSGRIRTLKFFNERITDAPDASKDWLSIILQPMVNNIETLTIGGFLINKIPGSLLSSCRNLRVLRLPLNSINQEGMNIIFDSLNKNLEELDLSECEINGFSHESKEKMLNCLNLKKVDFRENPIEKKADLDCLYRTALCLPRLEYFWMFNGIKNRRFEIIHIFQFKIAVLLTCFCYNPPESSMMRVLPKELIERIIRLLVYNN